MSAPMMISRTTVPLADPKSDNALILEELADAARTVIAQGPYINGSSVAKLEEALTLRTKTAGVVSVGCGTDALVIAMLALGLKPGDEVIVPSHTAGPSIAAIRMIGCIPVFVDVEDVTFALNPALVEQALSPRVKAIIIVHLYGHPADMDSILAIGQAHGLFVIEDCAQAQGALYNGQEVGSLGDVGCFSFYPTKNLGALGDGGAIISRHAHLIATARALRVYGWSNRPQFAEISAGRCSRLDEIQAAMLLVKLAYLDDWNAKRRAIAARYTAAFANLPLVLPQEKPNAQHVYHLYVVRSQKRDALEASLQKAGIGTGRHYPFPGHHQPGLAEGARIGSSLEVTDRLAGEILSLPIFPSMTEDQVSQVIETLIKVHHHV